MLQKGFTLIEMVIVIIILGIVAAIAIPQFMGTPENVMMQKETAEWKQHLESVKDKVFIIEIDGKKHSVVVKDVQE